MANDPVTMAMMETVAITVVGGIIAYIGGLIGSIIVSMGVLFYVLLVARTASHPE